MTTTDARPPSTAALLSRALPFPGPHPGPGPDEIHFTHAADGWQLGLQRYRPREDEGAGPSSRGEPVMLLHGLGGNHTLFDLGEFDDPMPVPSLARWLRRRGHDVWVADLRGSGHSERPGPDRAKQWDWTVDDMIHLDCPALVAYILRQTNSARLHWVGHSLGGILMLCHCGLHGSPEVASGTVISAGLDYSGTPTNYRFIEPLKGLGLQLRRVPSGMLSKVMSPIVGRFANTIESFNTYPGSTARVAQQAIYRAGTQDVSGEALYQLSGLFMPGGLRSVDGLTCYSQMAGDITTPVLLISGDRDKQCSPEVPEKTRRLLVGDQHAVRHFGKCHGHATHYGHFDLVIGGHAEEDVYPCIGEWLTPGPLEGASQGRS